MKKRAWATGTKQWPEVRWCAKADPMSFEDYGEDDKTINLMVGDLQRLRSYAERGFQCEVPVPKEIWEACDRLVAAGYREYAVF